MTVVLLILMAIFADQPNVVMEDDLVMPDGVSLAECEAAQHPPIPDGAIKFGWKCVAVDLLPITPVDARLSNHKR